MGASGKKGKRGFILKLFVSGASPNSLMAIDNLRSICETYIKGKYELEVIDVHQDTGRVEREQILALPLLVKKFPFPQRKFIGNMSNVEKLLQGLGVSTS
jgi:circadian clock protein KaiB